MAYLGKDILTRIPLKRIDVEIPELGTFLLRELTAAEQREVVRTKKALDKDPDGLLLMAVYIAYAWINEDGSNVVPASEAESLLGFGFSALQDLSEAVVNMSGLGKEAVEDAKKNSTET